MDKLADELLKDILSPPLRVPDGMFADTGMVSPFSKAMYSASSVLLVCKRWMRVGTPALYETVIIRSTAQAQALHLALTTNPKFGRFVRKLRLEGAYGGFITSTIVESMGRVTDFCFTLSVFRSDKLRGLTKALNMFDPKRVILTLHDAARVGNAQNKALVLKLSAAVNKWTKLEHFCFSTISPYCSYDHETVICPALAGRESLRTVELWPGWYGENSAYQSQKRLETLLTNRFIRAIVLHSAARIASPHLSPVVASFDPEMMDRLLFSGPGRSQPVQLSQFDSVLAPSCNPFYSPMRTTPRETRLRIWGEICAFAVLNTAPTDRLRNYHVCSAWFQRELLDVHTVKALLAVSRDLYEALLPVLFRDLLLDRPTHVKACTRMLSAYPWLVLGTRVRTLALGFRDSTSGNEDCTDEEDIAPGSDDLRDLCDLLNLLSAVQKAEIKPFAPALSDTLLSSLGSCSGHTLAKLTLWSAHKWSEALSFDLFAECTALKELHVDMEYARFSMSSNTDILANLTDIHAYRVPASFFASLSTASLPKLRSLNMYTSFRKADGFVKQHGHKIAALLAQKGLQQANMNAMPALTSLTLAEEVTLEELSKLKHEHVQQLRLKWMPVGRPTCLATYKGVLSAARFPALTQLVVAIKTDIWPATERDIKKSPWPEISAAFAAKGVTVVDHTGRSWRPRLQVQ